MCLKRFRAFRQKSHGKQAQGYQKKRAVAIGGGSVQVVWQQLIWQANRSLENADDREGTNGASAKLGCSS